MSLLPHELLPHELLPHELLPHELLPHKLPPYELLLGPVLTRSPKAARTILAGLGGWWPP